MATIINFMCDYCLMSCTRSRWEYKQTKQHFCSQRCAKEHRKKHLLLPTPCAGDKSHELMFVRTVNKKHKRKSLGMFYECLCNCGETTTIQRNKWGITKTCGVRKNHKGEKSHMFQGHGEISRSYWNSIITGAHQRNLEFLITIEYAWELYCNQHNKCALSGADINLSFNRGEKKTASLDRIDSSKGYVEGNVQWVHKTVNQLKMDLDNSMFQEWCYRIASKSNRFATKLDFDDVLIKPLKTQIESRNDIDLFTNNVMTLLPGTIPIIAANFDTVGTFAMARELLKHGLITCIHKYYSIKEYQNFFINLTEDEKNHIFYSTGAIDQDIQKLRQVLQECDVKNICLDVANAYVPQVHDVIDRLKNIAPNATLMVGNIATPEPIKTFHEQGVHFLKCGIGSGAVCTTRLMTGVGIPQLSCVLECAQEAKRFGLKICSDGGCRYPGDIAKALVAGADMVMIGSMLSGTNECEGQWIEKKGKKYLQFYGMSSTQAMQKYGESVKSYRASEGKLVHVPHKGPVADTIHQILGGLRSACTYTNSSTLTDLPLNGEFVKVNNTHNITFE